MAHFHPAEATADVKTKEPNNFGLYDVLGNVWESMANPFEEGKEAREFRGGCWYDRAASVCAALHGFDLPGIWNNRQGFRLLRPQD